MSVTETRRRSSAEACDQEARPLQVDRFEPFGESRASRDERVERLARSFEIDAELSPGSLSPVVFVTLGSLDRPELIAPRLEMFTKRRLSWEKSRHAAVSQHAELRAMAASRDHLRARIFRPRGEIR